MRLFPLTTLTIPIVVVTVRVGTPIRTATNRGFAMNYCLVVERETAGQEDDAYPSI